jgi:hypothetical protein
MAGVQSAQPSAAATEASSASCACASQAGALVVEIRQRALGQLLLEAGGRGVARAVFEREDMLLARHAGEADVDLDALTVADHPQRRVLQRQRMQHQLLQRDFEALARRLVLPGEVATQPDVGKTVGAHAGAAGLGDAALEQ